jgi:hypothetical protein
LSHGASKADEAGKDMGRKIAELAVRTQMRGATASAAPPR